LNKIGILPKVLNVLVIEYVFSMYDDIKNEVVLDVINIYGKDTTVKNNKIYTFDSECCYITITDVCDKVPFNFNRSYAIFVNDLDNYIYVYDHDSIHVFDEQCKYIRNIDISHVSYTYEGIVVTSNNICLYSTGRNEYVYFFDMKGNIEHTILVESILQVRVFNNTLYFLSCRNTIYTLFSDASIALLSTFPSENYTISNFNITDSEIYVHFTMYDFISDIRVYDYDNHLLRTFNQTSKDHHNIVFFDSNNTYILSRKDNKMSIYNRKKINLYGKKFNSLNIL